MIGYIAGEIKEIRENTCLILTSGGVGYILNLPAHTASLLGATGGNAQFYTYMSVREDAIELFGFSTYEERQAFEALKSINKVGSKTALAILSMYRPLELEELARQENLLALTKVPGIGKKTAQHILLELRYKLSSAILSSTLKSGNDSGLFSDIMAALRNLGYADEECGGMVRKILDQDKDIDFNSAIRLALKELAKGKNP